MRKSNRRTADRYVLLAIRLALKELGYPRHYYWDSMCLTDGRDNRIWTELLDRKYRKRETITKKDFDRMLSSYSSLADWPASLFAEELIKAYPKAKVILSVRDDATAWYRSFGSTVWEFQRRKFFPQGLLERFWYYNLPRGPTDEMYGLVMSNTPLRTFPTRGKQWYLDHNQKVRDLVDPKNLLEFNAKQGWEPLCKFLEKEVPAVAYPKANETAVFTRIVESRWFQFRLRKYDLFLRWISIFMLSSAAIFSIASYV